MSKGISLSEGIRKRRGLMLLPLVAVVAVAFGGCAIKPVPLTDAQRKVRIAHDMDALFNHVKPVSGPLTLYQALARALKYNYDARLKLMKEALANAQLNLSTYDLLPRMTVSAGYHVRNNDGLSTAVQLVNGQVTPLNPPSYSGALDRHHFSESAGFTWNILDFGVSYVRAKQQADQVLIANEQKRKVVQNIMQDVRQAYWRAYGAQQTLPHLDALLLQVKDALTRSRHLQHRRLLAPLDALNYQRSLIDLYELIVKNRRDLVLAKTRLEALINIKPGSDLVLAGNTGALNAVPNPHLFDNVDALDQAALADRPELRAEDYRKKITALEARKALFSLLPGLDLSATVNHDNNQYLYKKNWAEAGATVSFNLLKAFSYPAMLRTQKAHEKLDDTRRIALSMAVLTQVRIAVQRYHEAIDDYRIISEGADVDQHIEKQIADRVRARSGSDQMLLRAEVKAALSEMQRYASYADLQTSYARVANSVGIDMLPPAAQVKDTGALAKQLAQVDMAWREHGLESVVPVSVQPARSGKAKQNAVKGKK